MWAGKTSNAKQTKITFQYEFIIKMKLVEYVILMKPLGLLKCLKLSMGNCQISLISDIVNFYVCTVIDKFMSNLFASLRNSWLQ